MDRSNNNLSDAFVSTFHNLKKTGATILKKVPDLYYDPSPEQVSDNDAYFGYLSSSRGRMRFINFKRTEGSAYSTSVTSHSTETSGSGEVSNSNSTITTRPSMMAEVQDSTSPGNNIHTASPRPKNRPIVLVSQSSKNSKMEKKELLFEVSSSLEDTVIPEEEEPSVIYEDYDEEKEDSCSAKTRRLTLLWDEAQAVARRSGQSMALNNLVPNNHDCDTFELPSGITRDDILVTIDIDDTARSSRALEMEEKEMDVVARNRCNTDTTHSSTSTLQQSSKNSTDSNLSVKHRNFEEAVRQGILDDLRSVYTATPDTAKLVLCIVICILSDGSMQHTFWSGGRVGLAELALNWRLFDADDLKMYEGGIAVQRKDFGFGPLELSEAEGEYYMVTKLAPRAANDIVRRIGGVNEDFMAEI